MSTGRRGGSVVRGYLSLTVVCGLTGVALPLPPPGDATDDGIVSGADFTVWADNYLRTGVPAWSDGGWTVGNFNEDDIVDGLDFSHLRINYGLGGLPATVPGPPLACRVSDVGGGLYGFRLSVRDGYGGPGSFFANVTFQGASAQQSPNPGTIQQLQVSFPYPVPPNVNSEYDADLFDSLDPNYHKELDSYFLNPFGADFAWFSEDANYYQADIGTEAGYQYTAAPLAYICCTGDVVYDGIISHLGQEYSLSGIARIPAPDPRVLTIETTSGVSGTTAPDQSFNETCAVDATVLGPERLLVTSMTLKELNISTASGTVAARIYDSSTAALVASVDVAVSSGSDQTVTIPMAAVLEPGQDYRIGFFIEAGGSGGSADLFSPEGYPHWEDQGLFRMNGGYSIAADAFPADVNTYVPLTELEVARDWTEGDANLDGCVDGLDYNGWSLSYLQNGGWRGGDFNGDGISDGMDYNLWSLNYGHGWAGAAVPEPAALWLLALASPALILRRRR